VALSQSTLRKLYIGQRLSVAQIAHKLRCSQGQINYWLKKFEIKKRTIQDATYGRLNPKGDPFTEVTVKSTHDAFLVGLGIGLYWGEGTKKNKHAVRLGNTDPYLIKAFLLFLRKHFKIQNHRLKFGLQVFSDMNLQSEEKFWCDFLKVDRKQFYSTTVTKSGKVGNYREKSEHGVLTVYFHNVKLQKRLLQEIERMRDLR
jgi:hypothetical protein